MPVRVTGSLGVPGKAHTKRIPQRMVKTPSRRNIHCHPVRPAIPRMRNLRDIFIREGQDLRIRLKYSQSISKKSVGRRSYSVTEEENGKSLADFRCGVPARQRVQCCGYEASFQKSDRVVSVSL